MSILHDVCKDRAGFGKALVKIFLQLGKVFPSISAADFLLLLFLLLQFEALAERLIDEEVESTSDPNTLFRGNSVASKVIDEFMKVEGHLYLHRTLQTCIDEVTKSHTLH